MTRSGPGGASSAGRSEVELSAAAEQRARAEGADDWLGNLPRLAADLGREWGIDTGRTLRGGSEAAVLEARLADGSEAVLKLMPPGPTGEPEFAGAAAEITALRLAGGEGCVSLLRADGERGALLLERLGPTLHERGLPLEERFDLLCATVQQMWRPAPDCGLSSGAEKARWLADFITNEWERLDRPCSERVIDQALAAASRRRDAHDEARSVLLHGDLHEWNALEASGSPSGYRLIDPDPLVGEPEYDLGVLMREHPLEHGADGRDLAEGLAARTGLDATAIWEWAAVERVSTGLTCLKIGLEEAGQRMLSTAEQVAGGADSRS